MAHRGGTAFASIRMRQASHVAAPANTISTLIDGAFSMAIRAGHSNYRDRVKELHPPRHQAVSE